MRRDRHARSWPPHSPTLTGTHLPPHAPPLAVQVLLQGVASVPSAPQPSAVTYKRRVRNSLVYTQGGHPPTHTHTHTPHSQTNTDITTLSPTAYSSPHTTHLYTHSRANTHLILPTLTCTSHSQITHAHLICLCTLVHTCTHAHTLQIHSYARSPRSGTCGLKLRPHPYSHSKWEKQSLCPVWLRALSLTRDSG